MPDIIKKSNGDTDWNKFFMGFAVALVFVMQSYGQMQHNQTRAEIANIHDKYTPTSELNKDLEVNDKNIKLVLSDINDRLLQLEGK